MSDEKEDVLPEDWLKGEHVANRHNIPPDKVKAISPTIVVERDGEDHVLIECRIDSMVEAEESKTDEYKFVAVLSLLKQLLREEVKPSHMADDNFRAYIFLNLDKRLLAPEVQGALETKGSMYYTVSEKPDPKTQYGGIAKEVDVDRGGADE